MRGKPRWVGGAAIALIAALVSVIVVPQALGETRRPVVFYDPIGDNPSTAPDVSSVAVANDDTGRITIRINLATGALKRSQGALIGIDADRNASTGTTGSPRGLDYAVICLWTASGKACGVARPGADGWEDTDPPVPVVGMFAGRGLQVSFASSDFGVGRSFRFLVRTLNKNVWDDAPESGGLFSFTLGPASQIGEIQRIALPTLDLFLPKAGALLKAQTVRVFAGGQAGSVLDVYAPDKLRCSARIGSTVLPPAGRSCVFRVPQPSLGKQLVLTITVAYRGDEYTGVYPMKVE